MSDLTGTYPVVIAAKKAGIDTRQLQRWQKHGYIKQYPRTEGRLTHHRYTEDEIAVARIMGRLMASGFGNLDVANRLARKHLENLAVLASMGYASGENSSTEHTIGDGLVLTIMG